MTRLSKLLVRKGLVTLALGVLLVALVTVYAMMLASLRPETPGQEVALSEVLRRSEAKAITSVTFYEEDDRIRGVSTIEPAVFWSSVPEELLPGLTDRLVRDGATVTVDRQYGKSTTRFLSQFVMPVVLLVVLFTLLFLLTREGGSGVADFLRFGAVGNRRRKPESTTGFGDVGGASEAVTEMAEIARFLNEPASFQAMGAVPPRGVLLIGPPGCGKTLLARALASDARVPFLYLSGAEFVESLVGVGAARVRDLFAQARADSPAIVFIDELDAVGRRRGAGVGMGHDEREQTLNQLLVEMDGFVQYSGIVVIGATNRPDILDPALTRPGRFDRRVTVYEPDYEGRVEILGIHLRDRKLGTGISVERLARDTPGLTGADLASICNEAALLAVRDGSSQIEHSHLDEAVERVLLGPARRGHRLTEDERRRAAYHEAGHAVVARALGMTIGAQKVSIVARGRTLGHHTAPADGEQVLWSFERLMDELKVTMAGRSAELLAYDTASTASEGDIMNATNMARRLVCTYGMSDKVGRIRVGTPDEELFLGRDWLSQNEVSTALLEDVDNEIRRLIHDAEEEATKLLHIHRPVLQALATRLEEVETLRGEELDSLLLTMNGKHDVDGGQLVVAERGGRRRRGAPAT